MPLLRTQQPGYLIHPTDIPEDTVYHEKPSRVPDFRTDVLAVTVLFTVLTFGGLYSAYKGFWPGSGAALMGIVVAFWRVNWYLSEPLPEIKETTFQRVKLDTAEGNRRIPVHSNGTVTEVEMRNPKTLRHDGREYVFEGRQLDRMLDWLNQGYDSIRRETSALGPGLQEIGITGSNFTTAKWLMQHFGIISDDGAWTAAGREWLRTP